MQNISNYIKATLFFDDFSEINVKKEQGFTLQQFNYECSRKRNNMGMPYGPTRTTVLRLLIKSLPDGSLKEIYKRLDEYVDSSFSIVFNATFRMDENGENTLSDYDSALVITGFVVSISEFYGERLQTVKEETTTDLMMTDIEFLTKSITYIGSENYKKKLHINY